VIRTILAVTAASFGIASAQADEIQSGVQNPGNFAPVAQTQSVPQTTRGNDEIFSGVPNPGNFAPVAQTEQVAAPVRGTDWIQSGVQNPVRSGS
jgi:hypothetical protein